VPVVLEGQGPHWEILSTENLLKRQRIMEATDYAYTYSLWTTDWADRAVVELVALYLLCQNNHIDILFLGALTTFVLLVPLSRTATTYLQLNPVILSRTDLMSRCKLGHTGANSVSYAPSHSVRLVQGTVWLLALGLGELDKRLQHTKRTAVSLAIARFGGQDKRTEGLESGAGAFRMAPAKVFS